MVINQEARQKETSRKNVSLTLRSGLHEKRDYSLIEIVEKVNNAGRKRSLAQERINTRNQQMRSDKLKNANSDACCGRCIERQKQVERRWLKRDTKDETIGGIAKTAARLLVRVRFLRNNDAPISSSLGIVGKNGKIV